MIETQLPVTTLNYNEIQQMSFMSFLLCNSNNEHFFILRISPNHKVESQSGNPYRGDRLSIVESLL